MKRLTSADIVEVWEAGQRRAPMARAGALVTAAFPELGARELDALTLGAWHARLLAMRRALFGPTLTGSVACPACKARLEFALDAGELERAAAAEGAEPQPLALDGAEVRFRRLTAGDLAAAGRCPDAAAARRALAEACVVAATLDGEPVAAADLPERVVGALGERLAEADPGAETLVELECEGCGERWSAALDIGPFVWSELCARADRLLGEVDALARAYGWTEEEVLGLGPGRRRRYLEMAQ